MKYIFGYFLLILSTCLTLNAKDAVDSISYYGNADDNVSPYVFIAPNAEVYGREDLIVKQNTSPKDVKKAVKIKKEEPAPVESKITEQKPISVVFPSLPTPSSQSFFQDNSESAVISPHQRPGKQQLAAICCQKNICRASVNNSDVSLYQAEQRQKLSIAATQCGMFTSFASQSPPLPPTP